MTRDTPPGTNNQRQDLGPSPDLAMPAELPPAPCFTSQAPDWKITGDSYCKNRGALCKGVEFYGTSDDCTGPAHTACWGSGEGACCSYDLANHAGSPTPASGRWRCVAPGTPICGNGKLEGIEICDDGSRNGMACRPGIGGSCIYCSSVCTKISVTPAASDCITPTNSDWTVTGDAWCASRGKTCTGTAYFSGNGACMGTPHTECWSSGPRDCCKYGMDGHAGFADASARWQCQ